jgi:hypothetical protein
MGRVMAFSISIRVGDERTVHPLICFFCHISCFSIDSVIWFNERQMPDSFFEVEHSTDIQNSVTKFCDLQDFHSRFLIVAPQNRKEQFDKVMSRTAFKDIKDRVAFHSYESISKQYELMCAARVSEGFI